MKENNSTNKLIIPRKSVLTKQEEQNNVNFINEAYINALKYYAEDDTADTQNILPASMFLYSLGDKVIYENLNENETKLAIKENRIKESVREKVNSFSKSIITASQFRIKDRKFILDLNIYNANLYRNFLSLSFKFEGSLTYLFLSSLQEKILFKEGDINKKLITILDCVEQVTVNQAFNGIIDNVRFQQKIQNKGSDKSSDKYSGDYLENGYID